MMYDIETKSTELMTRLAGKGDKIFYFDIKMPNNETGKPIDVRIATNDIAETFGFWREASCVRIDDELTKYFAGDSNKQGKVMIGSQKSINSYDYDNLCAEYYSNTLAFYQDSGSGMVNGDIKCLIMSNHGNEGLDVLKPFVRTGVKEYMMDENYNMPVSAIGRNCTKDYSIGFSVSSNNNEYESKLTDHSRAVDDAVDTLCDVVSKSIDVVKIREAHFEDKDADREM